MTLLELAERCEREGPSRALDADIEVAMGFAPAEAFWIKELQALATSAYNYHLVPPYTASLDAAVAFAERSDPQAWWSIDIDGTAKVCLPDDVFGFSPAPETPQQFAATPALALVAAALRALAARDGAP